LQPVPPPPNHPPSPPLNRSRGPQAIKPPWHRTTCTSRKPCWAIWMMTATRRGAGGD